MVMMLGLLLIVVCRHQHRFGRVLYPRRRVRYRRFVGHRMVKSVGFGTILGLSCRGVCWSADGGWKSSGIAPN